VALWPWYLRRWLVFSALVFDSIFTLEFTARAFVSQYQGRFSPYIRKEFGWVDFLASVPLLILDSGPRFLSVISGAPFFSILVGGLATLRLVRLIRMIRLLRLLRLVRATAGIPSRRVEGAQGPLTTMTALILGGLVFGSIGFAVLETSAGFRGVMPLNEAYLKTITQEVIRVQSESPSSDEALQGLASRHPVLLGVNEGGRTVYLRHSPEDNARLFGVFDYVRISEGDTEIYLSLMEINTGGARDSLLLFFLGIVLLQLIIFGFVPIRGRQ